MERLLVVVSRPDDLGLSARRVVERVCARGKLRLRWRSLLLLLLQCGGLNTADGRLLLLCWREIVLLWLLATTHFINYYNYSK